MTRRKTRSRIIGYEDGNSTGSRSNGPVHLEIDDAFHNWITRLSTARYPALARPFIVSVAGTCLSLRTRPPCSNAFTLIETPTDGKELCHVSRYEYAKTERFEATMLQKYRRILGIWTEE